MSLRQGGESSRKLKTVRHGLLTVFFLVVFGAIVISFSPLSPMQLELIGSLLTVGIGAVATMVTSYVGIQGYSDARLAGNVQYTQYSAKYAPFNPTLKPNQEEAV